MLRDRLKVGIPLALAWLAALLWPGLPGELLFLVLAGTTTAVALREFFAMTAGLGAPGSTGVATGAGLLLLAGTALLSHTPLDRTAAGAIVPLVTAAVLGASFAVMFRRPVGRESLFGTLASLAGFTCICLPLGFLADLYYSDLVGMSGRLLVVYIVAVTKLADVGAFFVGTWTARRAGGNHLLTPRLSPKKSWEGLFGGIAASAVCSLALAHWLHPHLIYDGVPLLTPGRALVFGVAAAVLGLAGDLAESCLKRAAGVKDSGKLPGLGGALDTIDSLIVTAPFAYGCVRLIAAATAGAVWRL